MVRVASRPKTYALCAIVWACSISLMHGQIRSDFVLGQEGGGPCLKIDGMGNLHATWLSQGVYYGLFDSLGNPIRIPQKISTSNFVAGPRLAISDDYVVAVWIERSFTFNSYIIGQLMTLDGDTVSGNVEFNDVYFDAYRGLPDVVYLNDSTFIVVWAGNGPQTPSPTAGIYGQIATNSVKAIGSNIYMNDDLPVTDLRGSSRVASDQRNGDFVVVWRDGYLGRNKVFGRLFFSDGTPKDSSFLISEDPRLMDIFFLSLAMNPNGDFAVVWGGKQDTLWIIQLRRFQADGTPLSPSLQVNSSFDVRVGDPSVDVSFDSDGKFVVVWEQEVNGYSRIFAQRYLSDGTLLGGNFKVSSNPDSANHFYPNVVLYRGKMYTAWGAGGASWANIIDFNNPPLSRQDRTGQIPEFFQLYQNYPNPFNPSTTIRFEVPRSSNVRIVIYSVLGEEIVTLVNKEMMPGLHEVRWNGKDSRGAEVTSGIYLFRLSAEGYTLSRKMALIR